MGPTYSVFRYRSSSDVWSEQLLSILVENYDTVNKFLEENDEVRTKVGEIFNQDLPDTPPDMREWILEECTKD